MHAVANLAHMNNEIKCWTTCDKWVSDINVRHSVRMCMDWTHGC